MIKTKKQMFTVIGVFVLVMLLGTVTYAFFNYTRTGTVNTISTGQINFLTTQSNTLALTNVFPISSSEVSNANLDEVEIRIQGDTTYSGGEEFQITIEGVNNTVNGKEIPINFVARYVPTASGDVIGSPAVSNYYSERGSTTAVYELTETGVAENGKQVLVGFIPANGEIDGTLKISAYLDASNIAISDTYYENAPTPTPTAPNDEYGTTTEWVDGRTVLTTEEWNYLQNSQEPLSFKIKAVSQEGTWVEKPLLPGQIASCPGCKFVFLSDVTKLYYYTELNTSNKPVSKMVDFETNGDTLVDDYRTLNKNFFLGFKFDESENVTNAYACGIKREDPNQGTAFCIEGAFYDSGDSTARIATYNANTLIMNSLYNGCSGDGSSLYCSGYIGAWAYNLGNVNVGTGGRGCIVSNRGHACCQP